MKQNVQTKQLPLQYYYRATLADEKMDDAAGDVQQHDLFIFEPARAYNQSDIDPDRIYLLRDAGLSSAARPFILKGSRLNMTPGGDVFPVVYGVAVARYRSFEGVY